MRVREFLRADGTYAKPDGAEYDTAAEFIQNELFGFCGCGSPDDNLRYMRDGLGLLEALSACGNTETTWSADYAAWTARVKELFGNDQSTYFFWYFLDKLELSEHGGAVPGWLTEAGKDMLADLRELKLDGEEVAQEPGS